MSAAKAIRAALGIVVVVVLGLVVMNWWSDFKSAPKTTPSSTTATDTASTPSTATVIGIGVVQINGVNFRTKPSSSAKLIRSLKAGERVTIILKDGQWYKIEDSKGKTGWVTASGDLVTIQGQ